MDAQEIYDKACAYLCSMKNPSIKPGSGTSEGEHIGNCKYRSEDGNRCVIGYFIRDENYSSRLEGSAVYQNIVLEALGEDFREHENLLERLQVIHDAKSSWNENGFIGRKQLEKLGADHNLRPFGKGENQ